jgi:hypothetical protein
VNAATAVVAIAVAIIGVTGGYLGARWRARTELAQWRRERLLEFCANLVAAGRELLWLLVESGERRYPSETVRRFDHAVACVLLVGGTDLDTPVFAYQSAVLDAVNAALAADPQKQTKAYETAIERQASLLVMAHNLLLDTAQSQGLWWRLTSRHGDKPKTDAAAKT